jgi:putative addiction module component (TIGR02574 family)
MASAEQVLSDALALSTEDRAKVARELLRSLDDSGDEGAFDRWTDELRSRLQDVDEGRVSTLSLEEVKRRMAARRAARRAKKQ